jgi:hypothetical protein
MAAVEVGYAAFPGRLILGLIMIEKRFGHISSGS